MIHTDSCTCAYNTHTHMHTYYAHVKSIMTRQILAASWVEPEVYHCAKSNTAPPDCTTHTVLCGVH